VHFIVAQYKSLTGAHGQRRRPPVYGVRKKPPVKAAFESCGAEGGFDRRFLHLER